MVICTYEDRAADLIGVRLLALSIGATCPDVRTIAFCPAPLHELCRGLGRAPAFELRSCPSLPVAGWSIKPWLLLHLLDEGHEQVMWLDTDIIITSDFRFRLHGISPDALVVAGEPRWALRGATCDRAPAWGLSPGRTLPYLVNSCAIRVAAIHRPLLEHWKRLMMTVVYREAQSLPFAERPPHAASDQDVLHALLTSDRHADVAIAFLQPGVDIAQCHLADGYAVKDRLRNAFRRRLPPLVHSQGFKPWRPHLARTVDQDVSPYTLSARRYRQHLDDVAWISPSGRGGKILWRLTGGDPNLAGLLPALSMELQRALRIRTRLARWIKTSVAAR